MAIEDDVLQLQVAPVWEIVRDLKANLRFILGFVSLGIAWCLGSAGIADACSLTNKAHTYFATLYFTVINFTTVGFGDIAPVGTGGQALAMANAVLGLVFFGCVVAAITAAFQPSSFKGEASFSGRKRRSTSEERGDPLADALTKLLDAVREGDPEQREPAHVRIARQRHKGEMDVFIEIFLSLRERHTPR